MSIVSTLKSPPLWSPAYNPILWEVQSDQINQFKFRYVFDVFINYDPLNPRSIRFRVPANPAGAGLIDVSSLVQGALTPNQNLPFLSPTVFANGEGLSARVFCLAGEEYATTATGDPVVYNGLGGIGDPAYGLYADGDWRPAQDYTTPVVAWATGQGAGENYDYMSLGGEGILQYEMGLGGITPDAGGKFLTRCPLPTQTIRSDEDFTLTWLNYNFEAATGPQSTPYAMKAEFTLEGNPVGYYEWLNTEANGGTWPLCTTWGATGATATENLLSSFKINMLDLDEVEKDEDELFGGVFGCAYDPISQIFPGYHDTGLSPASNPNIILFTIDSSFIEPQFTSNCSSPFGIGYTGYSDLVYRNMQVKTGDTITIEIPSQNTFAGSHASMQLWGSAGGSNNPANFEFIGTFAVTNSGGNKLYSITATATKNYQALGLRWFSATTVSCGKFGCFSNVWNIESTLAPDEWDQVCFSLHPYNVYGNCSLGATASSEPICLKIDNTNCWGFDPIRFAWLNNLGGRDWFTFMKRNTYTQSASRDTFYQLPGYWSSSQYSVQDINPSRYGTSVFKIRLDNTWTASTDWLSEEQSEWLRGMFASPSVHAYLPGRSTPTLITITDATYTVETFARQKLFQYFVSFTEAQPDIVQSY